jgi:AcrR family transcriptional regulator
MKEKVLRRARQSSEKFERRCQILAAAEALFTEGGGELPSAQAIADRAGLAKGTMYLYFAAIEDIFIALLSEHTVKWLSGVQEKLRRARAPLTPDKVAAAMGVYPVEQPVVMRLASVSTFQITRPGTEAAYLALRQQFADTLTQFGQFLEESLPGLGKGRGLRRCSRRWR